MSVRARVRPAAVAGAFYPVRSDTLSTMVDDVLASVPDIEVLTETVQPGVTHDALGAVAPKALIVPHAGYIYSAPIAATAYAQLLPWRDRIRRVVLLGPAHRVPVRSMAVSSADAWATPLGSVALDADGRDRVLSLPGHAVIVDDNAHAPEHSLEVHVPFLQRVLGNRFTLLPIIVGGAGPDAVADVLDSVWGGDETLIVISTDLSHYHDDATAKRLDAATAATIASGSIDFGPNDACGAYPVRGMLTAARRHRLGVELLDLRNSADTAGTRDRVVGYGSFVLRPTEVPADDAVAAEANAEHFTAGERQALLDVAVEAVRARFEGRAPDFGPAEAFDRLQARGASFVTLRDGSTLLGCIGTITPIRPLIDDVADNAVGAAFRDPRMPELRTDEFARMSVHISVLTPMEPMDVSTLDELRTAVRPDIDGLLIEAGWHRGTFLPSVWEQVPDRDDFLYHLWLKAGLKPGTWPKDLKVYRYQTVEWGDDNPRPPISTH